jgi:Raf kinase inhibitor-like YbhB/YbcL family protein
MMTLTSPAFEFSEPIPTIHTGDASDISPALRWKNAPAKTKSFVLIMDDPDVSAGTWVHWVLYDLPATITDLPHGVPKTEDGPCGSKHGACWGVDRFERVGYHGPLPPVGKPHRYFFKLYALDKVLGLKPGATAAQVIASSYGRVLIQATLMGTYQRLPGRPPRMFV